MKTWLILLFAIAVWHLETYSSMDKIKSRLEYLTKQKVFFEICSYRVVYDCSLDNICGYSLIYETLEDTK
jgi:hypothetical protein